VKGTSYEAPHYAQPYILNVIEYSGNVEPGSLIECSLIVT